METMTAKRLKKACEKHEYILCRYPNGSITGINTKIAKLTNAKKNYKANNKTLFVSYKPCSFDEYINHKSKFI